MSELSKGEFVGEFRHNMEGKGRLTIPSRWRPVLNSPENHFLGLRSQTEKSVIVYPPKMIVRLNERLSEVSMGDAEAQEAIRSLMSGADVFRCDKQGRINLNDELINHAGLKKSVVLVGEVCKFRIYDEGFYDQLMSDKGSKKSIEDTLKSLGV